MRSFALGELKWSQDRWRDSTFVEFNYAVEGYWRNWERNTGVMMREICTVLINGNPNIKQSAKLNSVRDYMKLSIDKEIEKPERPSQEKIDQIRKEAEKLFKK